MTVLETARLRLETLTADEAAAIRAGDREGRLWIHDYPSDGDAVVAAILGEAGEHYDESAVLGVLQVRLRATGEAIGGIGFLWPPEDGSVEVGYGLAESMRGQGYASESLAAVLQLVREQGMVRVTARTGSENLPSQRVLQRAGFAQVGRIESEEGVELEWVLDLA